MAHANMDTDPEKLFEHANIPDLVRHNPIDDVRASIAVYIQAQKRLSR